MLKSTFTVLVFLGILSLLSGCSNSDDAQLCDSSLAVTLPNNICLVLEHEQLAETHREIIENKIRSGINTITSLMPIDNLSIRIIENPQLVIAEIGIGGYNPDEQEVILAIDANFNDLDNTLEENLIAQLAHEIHHAKRRRFVGYGNTLLQAAVSEGLADHFSIEVAGIDPPPWAVAITGDELQNWIDSASNSWSQPYNHSAWFVGTDPNIPRWTGYSIGFHLVKNYLFSYPERSPSNLYDEPASSFEL